MKATPTYRFVFDTQKEACVGDVLSTADVSELIRRARHFETVFVSMTKDNEDIVYAAFFDLVEALYGTGMVMKDFNGPTFDQGPFWLIRHKSFARLLRKNATLLTIRMYLHTMARGHRATGSMGGFPYVKDVVADGCFKAMIDRLEVLNAKALKNGQTTLENIHP